MAFNTDPKPACKHLVLDAGPLLSLSPLRGLAETYYTVPQVLNELKDKRAREHFEKLGLSAGVRVQVESPDAQSLAYVIQFAKKTGDYSVLSTADLSVLALAYALEEREKAQEAKEREEAGIASSATSEQTSSQLPHSGDSTDSADAALSEHQAEEDEHGVADELFTDGDDLQDDTEEEPLQVELERIPAETTNCTQTASEPATSGLSSETPTKPDEEPIYDDPSDEDDGEGEWITPSNVAVYKSKALQLIPDDAGKRGKKPKDRGQIKAGCMTADFAMQNVLLQMGLSLVGVEGKRIERVKTWVLRCHACFKICKDASRKFCPSCGNPTLLRASVTISSPTAGASSPAMQIHLKQNFQYKTRGTIYSIPAPKPGSAKTGNGEGLILREDQQEWVRAKKHADGKREREEKRMLAGAAAKGTGSVLGSWMDPDWVPEMLTVGAGGKGRSMRHSGYDGDMPVVGHGKKNPNERRRKK